MCYILWPGKNEIIFFYFSAGLHIYIYKCIGLGAFCNCNFYRITYHYYTALKIIPSLHFFYFFFFPESNKKKNFNEKWKWIKGLSFVFIVVSFFFIRFLCTDSCVCCVCVLYGFYVRLIILGSFFFYYLLPLNTRPTWKKLFIFFFILNLNAN